MIRMLSDQRGAITRDFVGNEAAAGHDSILGRSRRCLQRLCMQRFPKVASEAVIGISTAWRDAESRQQRRCKQRLYARNCFNRTYPSLCPEKPAPSADCPL